MLQPRARLYIKLREKSVAKLISASFDNQYNYSKAPARASIQRWKVGKLIIFFYERHFLKFDKITEKWLYAFTVYCFKASYLIQVWKQNVYCKKKINIYCICSKQSMFSQSIDNYEISKSDVSTIFSCYNSEWNQS